MARTLGMFKSLVVAVAIGASTAGAQAGGHTLRGIVSDSVTGSQLAGAFVVIEGTTRGVLTDSAGRFVFDSLAAGSHIVVAQHAALDSIGLSGLRRSVTYGLATLGVVARFALQRWGLADFRLFHPKRADATQSTEVGADANATPR